MEASETTGGGKGTQVTLCAVQSPWEPSAGTESEVGLVLLELHHEVMNIDELGPGWQRPELRLRQHPVEAMVELDQLG